jgi:hypothetical protein
LVKWFYRHLEYYFLGEDDKLTRQRTLNDKPFRTIKLSREFCPNTKVLII